MTPLVELYVSVVLCLLGVEELGRQEETQDRDRERRGEGRPVTKEMTGEPLFWLVADFEFHRLVPAIPPRRCTPSTTPSP